MMNFILEEENDALKPEHWIVCHLLNNALKYNIISAVENLNKGIGSGYDYVGCYFWNNLDEYDKSHIAKFDGLLVYYMEFDEEDVELIISLEEFDYYLELLYTRLVNMQFDNLPRLRQLLDEFRTLNNIK